MRGLSGNPAILRDHKTGGFASPPSDGFASRLGDQLTALRAQRQDVSNREQLSDAT